MTPELRNELNRIQSELKKVLPPHLHSCREIPGSSKKWVYLPWQAIRDRLDEVVPEWAMDFSEIQYINNDAICRCGITILGVRKEAIAYVPISSKSNAGNEMTRGGAPDRLACEGLKNAAELWGVGRYIDDQAFVVKYLWDNRIQISSNLQEDVTKLCNQYGVFKMTHVSEKVAPPVKKLAQAVDQNLRVRQIRLLLNYPTNQIVEWLAFQNVKMPNDLKPETVDKLVRDICLDWAKDKFDHPNHAENSYKLHVLEVVAADGEELKAIQDWVDRTRSANSKGKSSLAASRR